MRILPNPKVQTKEDAMVTFHTDSLDHYRLRHDTDTGAGLSIVKGSCAAVRFFCGNLRAPFAPGIAFDAAHSTTVDADFQKFGPMVPTAANPADQSAVSMLIPNQNPYNVSAYANLYTRYVVDQESWKFTINNYHMFPLICGITTVVGEHNINTTATHDGTEVGHLSHLEAEPFGKNAVYMRTLPMTRTYMIPAAKRADNTKPANDSTQYEEAGLAATPGTRTIRHTVAPYNLLQQVTQQLSGQDPDLNKHGGAYSTLAAPVKFGPTTGGSDDGHGVYFWLWVFPYNANYVRYNGTSSTADDTLNAITFENIGSGVVNSWTASITMSMELDSKVRLYDPILSTFHTSAIPDLNTAA